MFLPAPAAKNVLEVRAIQHGNPFTYSCSRGPSMLTRSYSPPAPGDLGRAREGAWGDLWHLWVQPRGVSPRTTGLGKGAKPFTPLPGRHLQQRPACLSHIQALTWADPSNQLFAKPVPPSATLIPPVWRQLTAGAGARGMPPSSPSPHPLPADPASSWMLPVAQITVTSPPRVPSGVLLPHRDAQAKSPVAPRVSRRISLQSGNDTRCP